jgi:hypothetical protein
MPFGIKEVKGEYLLSVVVFSHESELFEFWNNLLVCKHCIVVTWRILNLILLTLENMVSS